VSVFIVFRRAGNFGTVFVDQSYWQCAVAAKPSQAVWGFLAGGLKPSQTVWGFLAGGLKPSQAVWGFLAGGLKPSRARQSGVSWREVSNPARQSGVSWREVLSGSECRSASRQQWVSPTSHSVHTPALRYLLMKMSTAVLCSLTNYNLSGFSAIPPCL